MFDKIIEIVYPYISAIVTCLGFIFSIIVTIYTFPMEDTADGSGGYKKNGKVRSSIYGEHTKTPKNPKLQKRYAFPFLIFIALLTSGSVLWIEHYKLGHALIPEIGERESLAYVLNKFQDAGLLEPRIIYDELALEKLAERQYVNDHCFVVVGCSQRSGRVVNKKEKVELIVSWQEEFRNQSTEAPTQKDFMPDVFYAGMNSSNIYEYHTGDIQLLVLRSAIKMTAGSETMPPLNIIPPRTEKTIIEAELVDFHTQEVVDEEAGYLGDEIRFSNVQTGTYYYRVSCNGYTISVSDAPFRIIRDDRPPEILYWHVGMEMAGNSYSAPFKIQVVDEQGNALPDTSINVRAVSEHERDPKSMWYHQLVTDKSGYLNLPAGDYMLNGGIVTFQVGKGHILELWQERESYIPVIPDGNDVICIILNQNN